jgi:peptidoglycan/xylan/chitin deacetylase (PgdA/CDA1 family)
MRIFLLFILLCNLCFSEEVVRGIYIGDTFFIKSNRIALTFDDGITPSTEKTLDTLKKWNEKHPTNPAYATFFCISGSLQGNTRIINRILNEGHTFGNHTRWHQELHNMPIEKVRTLIKEAQDDYKKFGIPVRYFRPPSGQRGHGATSVGDVDRVCKELGLYLIIWNIPTSDISMYNKKSPKTEEWCFKYCMDLLKTYKGGVFLTHDISKTCLYKEGMSTETIVNFHKGAWCKLHNCTECKPEIKVSKVKKERPKHSLGKVEFSTEPCPLCYAPSAESRANIKVWLCKECHHVWYKVVEKVEC